MKVAAFLMITALAIPLRSSGQEFHSTLSLAAEAGYLSNTYLHPILPIWETADAPFLGVEPSARLAWVTDGTYAGVEGRLRLIERFNPQDLWSMASAQARFDRRLGRNVAIGLDGAISRVHFSTDQSLAWGGSYLRTRFLPNLGFTIRLGASYRNYDSPEDATAISHSSTFAVAQLDLASADPWALSGYGYASRPVTEGVTASGGGASIRYTIGRDFSLGVEAGADRFGPSTATWRGAATADWDAGTSVSWSGRLGIQQFLNSSTTPDVFASISFRYRWQHREDLGPPPPIVWIQQEDEIVLQYAYEAGEELYLVGDFNEWTVGATALRQTSDGIYSARLSLPPGRYEYKIMVVENGTRRWLPLPDDVLTTDDDFGGTNGILLVETY